MGMVAVLLVLAVEVRADEASAVKAIEKLGGKVTRDDNKPDRPVIAVDLSFTKVMDTDLKELKQLKQLTHLHLMGTQVTDAGLKEIKELKQLTALGLYNTEVTDVAPLAEGIGLIDETLSQIIRRVRMDGRRADHQAGEPGGPEAEERDGSPAAFLRAVRRPDCRGPSGGHAGDTHLQAVQRSGRRRVRVPPHAGESRQAGQHEAELRRRQRQKPQAEANRAAELRPAKQ
jgi:hypothetical protein